MFSTPYFIIMYTIQQLLLYFYSVSECFHNVSERLQNVFSDNICSCIASTCLLLSSFEATVELCSKFYFQSFHVGYLPLPLFRLSLVDALLVVPIDIVFSSNYKNSFSIISLFAQHIDGQHLLICYYHERPHWQAIILFKEIIQYAM